MNKDLTLAGKRVEKTKQSSFLKGLLLVAILFLFNACGGPAFKIEGFDGRKWKNDPNGCEGKRAPLVDKVLQNKEQLLGMGEVNLRSVLGKPDGVNLYTRKQKFYIYFIQSGKQCDDSKEKEGQKLVCRFNATGIVNKIETTF